MTRFLAVIIVCSLAGSALAIEPPLQLANSEWKAAESPVYCDPDDDWAKDPSVIKAGDSYDIYYTSAHPWQDSGQGGKGESRIDYATSSDGLKWNYQGLSIPRGKPGEWDEERGWMGEPTISFTPPAVTASITSHRPI